MNVLLLCAVPSITAGTIVDHVDSIVRLSRHNVCCFRHVGDIGNRLPSAIDLAEFDAIVIHYSIYLLSDSYLSAAERARIGAFPGPKVLFLQDEYRQINRIHAVILELRIDVLFTCVPEPEIEKVYPSSILPGLEKLNNLTGYVPTRLVKRTVPAVRDRPIDVGYRARIVPFWLGELGAEKWQIADRFSAAVTDSTLVLDISNREEDRLYGAKWIQFVSSCKAMLGVESGASVFDFDGRIQEDVETFQRLNPSASFEDVATRFLRQHEGKIRLNQISPRSFEAAALRTAMVLFEGEYSGILRPWRHYVPLRKDLSNVGKVMDAIRNPACLQAIVDRTFREIALNPAYSYEMFVSRVDAALEKAVARKGVPIKRRVSRIGFAIATVPSGVYLQLISLWLRIPAKHRTRIKPSVMPIASMLRRIMR